MIRFYRQKGRFSLEDLRTLATEQGNRISAHIDEMSTVDMLHIINREDQKVALAIPPLIPRIAQAVDLIAQRLARGGRLLYCGAGTSGRLGVLDAAECPPTFGVAPEMVQGLIAGGPGAMFTAREGAEDDASLAPADLEERGLTADDVVFGLSASGRTPYVVGALRYARSRGAATISLACTPHPAAEDFADISLAARPGPEVITGSTRMKAGSVEKMILNMISTSVMIKLGKVYGNRMVDVKATNAKLRDRAVRIVAEVTGQSPEKAAAALKEADGSAKLAIFLLLSGLPKDAAQARLDAADGHLGRAIQETGCTAEPTAKEV